MSQNKAIILDPDGPILGVEEKALFRDQNPHGFILFQQHCQNPDQVRRLVDDLRECVGRDNAPVLIDQEGGSVARLRMPEFEEFPGALKFRQMAKTDLDLAEQAAFDNGELMAQQLSDLGINVNCTPVLDIPVLDSHEFLAAKRVYGDDPETVTALGRKVCEAHLANGVTPIFKHIPGHGRATVDSHIDLPKISAGYSDLQKQDFKPFIELSKEPWMAGAWAMTAHVIYNDIDAERPGTLSPKVITDIIRGEIGFDGVLIADDVSMKALRGDMADLAFQTLSAGCGLTLLCNQDFETNRRVLEKTPVLREESAARLKAAEDIRVNRAQGRAQLIA